jgi:hypothetical protein
MEVSMTLADELTKLQQLRESGSLTDEEFQQAKARLLDTEPPLSPSPPQPPSPAAVLVDPEREARQWAFFLHLSQYAHTLLPLGGLILPIVLWQIKKDDYPSIDAHGKNVVNWAISMFIYFVIAVPLCFILVGIPLVVILGLAALICPLIGAIKANNGEIWTYPGTIHVLK